MELIADCHGVEEVNLMAALGCYSMVSLIESLERMERARELATSLCVELNLKDCEGQHTPTGAKSLMRSSSAPYCNSKYLTQMVYWTQ